MASKLTPDLAAQWLVEELGGTWEDTSMLVMCGSYPLELRIELYGSILYVITGLFKFNCSLADPTLVDQLQAQIAKHYHSYALVSSQPELEPVERPWLNDTD